MTFVENEQRISKEQFLGLCQTIEPVLQEVTRFMKDNGIEGLAGVSVSASGYLSLYINHGDWYLSRLNENEEAKIENRGVMIAKL